MFEQMQVALLELSAPPVVLPLKVAEPMVALNLDNCRYFKSFTLPPVIEVVAPRTTWSLIYKQGVVDVHEPSKVRDMVWFLGLEGFDYLVWFLRPPRILQQWGPLLLENPEYAFGTK